MISDVLFRLSVFPKNYSNEEVVKHIFSRRLSVTFVNPLVYLMLKNDPSYNQILSSFDVLLADGGLLAWFASRVRRTKVERRSFDGNSIAPFVFREAADREMKIAFIGGGKGVAEEASKIVNKKYPGLVAYHHHGFFSDEELRGVVSDYLDVDVIVLGMGAPRQDCLALTMSSLLPSVTIFTCGGYFDQMVVASNERYYPEWVNKLNIRALYRFIREPRRLWRRYFINYYTFYVAVFRFALFKKLS